jgi:hypothetical protein
MGGGLHELGPQKGHKIATMQLNGHRRRDVKYTPGGDRVHFATGCLINEASDCLNQIHLLPRQLFQIVSKTLRNQPPRKHVCHIIFVP